MKNSEIKDKENDIVLKLIFSDIIVYELDKRGANILKSETTRALYYLLSKNAEGIFTFDKHTHSSTLLFHRLIIVSSPNLSTVNSSFACCLEQYKMQSGSEQPMTYLKFVLTVLRPFTRPL